MKMRKEWFCVFLFFFGLFFVFSTGFDTSEGTSAYLVAQQIVTNGRISFDLPPNDLFVVAPNGNAYLSHEIGNVLFQLPVALLNHIFKVRMGSVLNRGLLSRVENFTQLIPANIHFAICAATLFMILRKKFRLERRTSFLAVCLIFFTSFLWAYSRSLFDGALCATLLTVAVYFLFEYGEKERPGDLIMAFIFFGFGFITRLTMVLCVFSAECYLVFQSKRCFKKVLDLVISGFVLLPFACWQAWYNLTRTGFFYKSGVQASQFFKNNALDGNLWDGMMGLLISPGKSIFVYAPLLLFSIFFFRRFSKEHRAESLFILFLSVLWLLLHSILRSWYGAWGWGPRHFVTIIPVLFLPFAVYLGSILKRLNLKILLVLLGFPGLLLSLASIVSNWHYRMSFAFQNGYHMDKYWVWSFNKNQAVDMFLSGAQNLFRCLDWSFHKDVVLGASKVNIYASNSINVWWNSAIFSGVGWFWVAPVVVFFLSISIGCGLMILKNENHAE